MSTQTKPQTGHTPGPWKYGALSESVITERGIEVCSLQDSELDSKRANARLIAAAPELLDALQLMRDRYGKLHDALSDCIESGRLQESDLPDDYRALANYLADAIKADQTAKTALLKAIL
jgi:hypothetical protein